MRSDSRFWLALAAMFALGCSPAPKPASSQAQAADLDTDGDGIPDQRDLCVHQKEDHLPPKPNDGCPTTDPDQDGLAGEDDSCPDEAETVNGYRDHDGCPDEKPAPRPRPPQRVGTSVEKIEIKEEIRFATGKAEIEHVSVDLVETIAGELKMHPDIDFIEIAGHADKRGNAKKNLDLTQKRAEAVMKLLADSGVNAKRLRATGFGSYCPLDPHDNDEAYAKNRRVEFIILRRGGADLTDYWKGCDAASKEGISVKPVPDTAPRSNLVVYPKEVTLIEGRLLLPADILFVPGKSQVKKESEGALQSLLDFLQKNPQYTMVRIEGHTAPDKKMTDEEHSDLSWGRSRFVAKWLVAKGLDGKRLLPVGCSNHRYVYRGKAVDEERSRRTELHVIETSGKPEAGVPVVPFDCEE